MDKIEVKYQVPIIKDIDVLVIGGGPAGIAAAIASAIVGANTVLVEQNGYLGGMATSALVGPFMTSYSPDGNKQIIKGIFEELVRRMEKEGGAIHPGKVKAGSSYSSYIKKGHNHVGPFDPECLKRISEALCLEVGVDLLYYMFFLDTFLDDSEVKGGIFASKSGLSIIKSKITIDCTGDADVAFRAGAITKQGREQDKLTQPTTLFFRVTNIDKKKMEEYLNRSKEPDAMQFSNLVEKARSNGDFPIEREKVSIWESVNPGIWGLNMTRIHNINATDPLELTRASIEGRKQVQIIINFMKKYMPGCENVRLIDSAPQIGVRESRRIVGEYVLTEEDVLDSRNFEDSIALGAFPIDIHQPNGKSGAFILSRSNKEYKIPFRCLIPKNILSLLVAGRCISGTHEALGSARVMPICFATGQAAGVAAAISAKEGIQPRDLNIKLLRSTLLKQGAVID